MYLKIVRKILKFKMIFILLFNECFLKIIEGENCILLKKYVLDIWVFLKISIYCEFINEFIFDL